MEIERNDVDISRLFTWGRVFEVINSENEVEACVYMRLLGDADANRARVFAIRKSAELRRNLLDENSNERLAYIKTMDSLSDDNLKNLIVIYSMREISNDAHKNINVKRPTPPKSNAALSKMEKYQREIDNYPGQFRDALEKQMQKEVARLKKFLESETKETLYRKYVNALIDEMCEQEAINSYRNMELYLGCYKDDGYKERFFSSFEEYDNLDTQVKADFRAAYEKLDMRADELKKLREATP